MPDESRALTANQVVGYNLARIRKTLGLSQEEAAERLEPYLPGKRWSKNVYSAAERSYDGKRIRQFTGDELVAMSLAFGVSVVYFFMPPRPADRQDGEVLRSGKTEVSWRSLIEGMVGGTHRFALRGRALELPSEERPALNSHSDLALLYMSSDPPPGPLGGWMSAPEPEDQS